MEGQGGEGEINDSEKNVCSWEHRKDIATFQLPAFFFLILKCNPQWEDK